MQSSRPGATRDWPLTTACSRSEALRLAFTLLELLIAITIIAILAGLILTVAGAVSIKAHNAQVAADITSLSTGIAAFKQRFGVEPPSTINLYEQSSGWTNSSDVNAARSLGLIRQIWPQFDITINRDINGDGDMADTITLSGAECLVFFLGGPPALITTATPANQGGLPMGFSQNPADPFSRVGTTNRVSFTELDANRLLWYQSTQTNRMNTYLDPLAGQTQPYLYLSGYGGQGYNLAELVNSLTSPTTTGAPGGTFVDIYRQGAQGYWAPTNSATPYAPPFQPESGQNLTANTNTASPPWNANSFQIISPGGDHQYGVGGEYESANGSSLLILYPGTTAVDRSVERDNITNFSSGTLAP